MPPKPKKPAAKKKKVPHQLSKVNRTQNSTGGWVPGRANDRPAGRIPGVHSAPPGQSRTPHTIPASVKALMRAKGKK